MILQQECSLVSLHGTQSGPIAIGFDFIQSMQKDPDWCTNKTGKELTSCSRHLDPMIEVNELKYLSFRVIKNTITLLKGCTVCDRPMTATQNRYGGMAGKYLFYKSHQ